MELGEEWSTQYDENAEAYYYYNNSTGETTWEFPQQTFGFEETRVPPP